MGALTLYLQREFARLAAAEWICQAEGHVLSAELEQVLGYAPRTDVILAHRERPQRLWVEFEVSRADPVANHAKFAAAHLFQPQLKGDTFVAMVSPHVAPGRRNLAANMVQVMRRIGMSAFQTVLLPQRSGLDIQRLNHLSLDLLLDERPDAGPELERVFAISEPVLSLDRCHIHFAGDLLEVMMNLRRWNEDISTEEGATQWGQRRVTYFVYDPRTSLFAPSKFCAYVPISLGEMCSADVDARAGLMTVSAYAKIDQSVKIFDGTRARTHLTKRLGMTEFTPMEQPRAAVAFDRWMGKHSGSLAVSPSGPAFLLPPTWALQG